MPDRPATALHVPEAVREATSLPGRLVYTALDGREPLTVEELVTHTGVSRRATKRALGELREADLVEADTHPVDGRRKLYTVDETALGAASGENRTPPPTSERKDLEI